MPSEQIHELLLASDAAAARQNDYSCGVAARASLTEGDLERLLVAISARKLSMQQRSAHDNLQLLLHFLEYSRHALRLIGIGLHEFHVPRNFAEP